MSSQNFIRILMVPRRAVSLSNGRQSATIRYRTRDPYGETAGTSGYAMLHSRTCVARGRLWEAEYCISAARDQVLTLACLRRGLKTSYGRGFDDLPRDELERFTGALVGSLDRSLLLDALGTIIDALLHSSGDVRELASRLESQLRELKSLD